MKKRIIALLNFMVFVCSTFAGLLHYPKTKTFYGSHCVIMSAYSAPQMFSLEGSFVKIYLDADGNPEYYTESLYQNDIKKLHYKKTADDGSVLYEDDNEWGIWIDEEGVNVNCGQKGVPMITTRVYKTNPDKIPGNGSIGGGSIGTFNSGGNTSGSSGSSYRTCSGCGGSGTCTGCGGSGKYWVESGTYTGSGSRTRVNCGSCGGSGRCRVCYGKGKL